MGSNTRNSMITGNGTEIDGRFSTGFGHRSKVLGDRATALGYYATAYQGYSTALGAWARADGIGATVIGNDASGSGRNAVVVGSGANVDTGAGLGGIAIGGNARAGTAGWSGAIALGASADATHDGVALGHHATASASGAVALGRGSVANEGNSVSVGSASTQRRIVNVADARLSDTSTDAVTGKQLHKTNADLGVVRTTANAAKTAADQALANTRLLTQTSASSTIRMGADNTGTMLDVRNKSNANRKISGVADAVLSATSTEAVTGRQLNTTNTNVTTAQSTANTAKTAADAAAARVTTLSGLVGQVSATGNVRLGAENTGIVLDVRNKANANRKISGIADATLSGTSTEAVTGRQLTVTNSNVTAAQNTANTAQTTAGAARTTADNALAQATTLGGLVGQVSATGNVRLGAENSGTVLDVRNKANANRKISGIADATLSGTSTEAVTGRQLTATNSNVTTAQTTANAAQTTAGTAKTTADDALAQATTLGGLVGQVSATGNVRLGAENTGTVLDVRNKTNANRKISGVADAALSGTSTEAVTGRQLNTTNSNVTAAQNTANTAQTTAGAARTAADNALVQATTLGGLVGQVSATGNVRLGAENSGTVLDVRNKANANRKISGIADATLSGTSTEAVTGRQLTATNSNVTTAQNTANTAQTTAGAARTAADNALAQATTLGGLVGQVSATGNVRLGAENSGTVLDVANKAGARRRISNVADGVLSATSSDAVSGQQLFAANETAKAQGLALSSHATQLTAHAGRIDDNRDGLDRLREEFEAFNPDLDSVVKFSDDRSLVEMGGARVTGIADGDISSAASTDAVNGGQLFTTNQRVSKIEEQSMLLSIDSSSASLPAESGWLGVAVGSGSSAMGAGSTAIGSFALAEAENSVAVGRGSAVLIGATGGFALGSGTEVAAENGVSLGSGSRVMAGAARAVAIGSGSVAREEASVSFGNDTLKRRLVNVGRGAEVHDATTIAQLNESLATLGGGAGMDANGNVIAPTYTMQGSTQRRVADALNVLDGTTTKTGTRVGVIENQLRSMFDETTSARTGGVGQLSLAGAQGMVLTNLADGRLAPGSRDAVTGNQLHAAKQEIARNKSEIDQMKEQQDEPLGSARQGPIDFAGARVTGLAEGDISSVASTDAVTGGQLFATNSEVASLKEQAKYLAVGVGGAQAAAKAGLVAVALGDYAEASLESEGAVAVGSFSQAHARNSVALGRAAYIAASADAGFALGTQAEVLAEGGMALGAASSVARGAANSVAVGNQSVAKEVGTVSFGNDNLKRRLVNVGRGISANDATTVAQLNETLRSIGGGARIDANGNIVGPSFSLQGRSHATLGDALQSLDGAVTSTGSRMDRVEGQLRSVFQDTPTSRTDGIGQLTLAGAQGMVISNVANGLIAAGSRDAVNGGQLHAMQQQLNGRVDGLESRLDGQPQGRSQRLASAEAPVTPPPATEESPIADSGNVPKVASNEGGGQPAGSPKKKDEPAPKAQVDTAELEKMLARANEYTDGAISSVERRLDKMDKRFNRMAAMGSAQSAMAMNTAGLNTYNRLGAGVGYSEGESAMAVGYQRVLNDKGSATFSLSGAFTNSGERTVGVGVGIGW
ncbi:YadA-like family protein [Stenotrophomonas maltophilia]|uniref:YadA-like family protein n=1 Tax=Stenotrophomonas maltophilia TaxID=40324 RepID=UPI001F5327A2|nr:YadA-like family protein [Stenotrophomonas maltophilia]